MTSKMASFSSRLKDLQKEGENYSALGQILSKSSPASAELINQASFEGIQSQANSIIEKMKAEIARQQAEAQKRAQEAAQAQAQAAAQAQQQQVNQAQQQANQLKPPELPKPPDMTPDVTKYDPKTHTFITDQNLKSMASIVSPEEQQVMQDETARRIKENADVAKGISSPVGFATRAKMFEDAFNTGFNPEAPKDTETMINTQSGSRDFVPKSTIPKFQAAAQNQPAAPSPIVGSPVAKQQPDPTKAMTPDVTPNPMGGTVPTTVPHVTPPEVKPPSSVSPTITADTIRNAGIPEKPRMPEPEVESDTVAAERAARGGTTIGTIEQPRGMGINDMATRPAEESPERINMPVERQPYQEGQDQWEDLLVNRWDANGNRIRTLKNMRTGEIREEIDTNSYERQNLNQPRMVPNPIPASVPRAANGDPITPTLLERLQGGMDTQPLVDRGGSRGQQVAEAQFKANPLSVPSMKSEDFPVVKSDGFYGKPVTADELIKKGQALPEDRDYWNARLEQDNSRMGGLQKVLPDTGGQVKPDVLEGWRPTAGGGFIHPTKGYAASRADITGQQQDQQGPGSDLVERYKNATGTVLGTAAGVYNEQAGKPADEGTNIIGQAISAYGKDENSGWARPALEAAGRLAFEKETGQPANKAPQDYLENWIYGYTSGKPVTLGDELDQDLLRSGVKPVGYENAQVPPRQKQTASPVPEYNVAFGFNQPYSSPFNKSIPNHRGVDLVVPGAPNNGRGSDVTPFQPGTVVALTNDPNGGRGVIIQTPDGLYNRYFHFDAVLAQQGQQVDSNTVIGKLGASGTEGFPHLHFEVSKSKDGDPMGKLIDPTPYMTSNQYDVSQEDDEQPLNLAGLFKSRSDRQPSAIGGLNRGAQMPNQLAGTNPQPGLVAGSGQDGRDMIARVYQRALQETGDDGFAHSLAALTVGEGGLGGANGDYGKSTGAFQFYWGGGEGNQFQNWLSQQWGRPVSQAEAMNAAKDIDTSLDYYVNRAYQFYKNGLGLQESGGIGPLAIALGGHNAGVLKEMRGGNYTHANIYKDAWNRYQAGEVVKGLADRVKTIAGVSGG